MSSSLAFALPCPLSTIVAIDHAIAIAVETLEAIVIAGEFLAADGSVTVLVMLAQSFLGLSPLAVPSNRSSDKPWESYTSAWTMAYAKKLIGEQPDAATVSLSTILGAYATDSGDQFNAEVAKYQKTEEKPRSIVLIHATT